MPDTRVDDLVSLDASLPTCDRHPDRVSYIRCRRCDHPMCPDCRTASRRGLICHACTAELRDADSPQVGPPLPVATGIVVVIMLLLGIAQDLSPDMSRFLAYAPFATLVEPWRLFTGLATFTGAFPVASALVAVVALGLTGFANESLRGIPALLTSALTCGIAGAAAAYLLTGSASPLWYVAATGPWAMIAGLAVSGAAAAATLHRWGYLVPVAAGALLLCAAAVFIAPVPPAVLGGGVAAALTREIVRAFFRKPQRAVMPLMVSGLVAWVLIGVAFLVRSLLG